MKLTKEQHMTALFCSRHQVGWTSPPSLCPRCHDDETAGGKAAHQDRTPQEEADYQRNSDDTPRSNYAGSCGTSALVVEAKKMERELAEARLGIEVLKQDTERDARVKREYLAHIDELKQAIAKAETDAHIEMRNFRHKLLDLSAVMQEPEASQLLHILYLSPNDQAGSAKAGGAPRAESRAAPTNPVEPLTAPRIPEGWKLVPRTMTQPMIEAAQRASAAGFVDTGLWLYILDAAPEPPVAPRVEKRFLCPPGRAYCVNCTKFGGPHPCDENAAPEEDSL